MKKVLLILIILLEALLSRGQLNVGVEIYCDGSRVLDAIGLSEGDISWAIKDLTQNPGCSITSNTNVYIGGYDPDQQIIIIDLDWLNGKCISSWNKGDDIELSITITKASHPFYGYSGTFVFKAPGADTDFFGNSGINLVGIPSVDIKIKPTSLEFCQGATTGNELEATVSDATITSVTWQQADGSAIPGLSASGLKANFSGVLAGNYQVVAKANGVSSNEVTVKVKPVPQQPLLTKVPATSVCAGEEVSVNIQNVETGVNYTWSPAPKSTTANGAVFDVAKNTKYNVTPVLNGCSGSKSADMTFTFKQDLTLGAPTYECFINVYQASIPVPGIVKAYTSPDANPGSLVGEAQMNTTDMTLEFMDQPVGSHTYYIKGDDFCGTKELVLNKNCGCEAKLAMTGGGTFCEDAPKDIVIALTVSQEFKKWSFILKDPDGNPVKTVQNETTEKRWTYKPTKSGKYTIENFVASNSAGAGCGELTGSPLTVLINPKPTVNLSITPKTEDCFGAPLTLTATPGTPGITYNYIWTGPGAASQNVAVVNTTFAKGKNNYSVKIQDPTTNCISEPTTPQEVIGHHVDVSITAPASVANGAIADLTARTQQDPNDDAFIKSYVWQGTGGFTGASSGASLTAVKTGKLTAAAEYTVTVTDQFDCVFESPVKRINVSGTALAVEAKGGSVCQGVALSLSCTPSGGDGNGEALKYTYHWIPQGALVLTNPDVQNPVVDVTTPVGKYKATVEVIDVGTGNTVTSEEVEVEIKAVPVLTNLMATPNAHVNSGFSTLSVTVNPEEGTQLGWTPIELIENGVNAARATTKELKDPLTTFTVKASLNGCSVEKSVDVTVSTTTMTVTAEGSEGCAGAALTVEAKVQGGAPKYNFLWENSTPAGVILNNSTIQKPTIQNTASLKPGTYSIPVTVTDQKGQSKRVFASVTIFGLVNADITNKCNPDRLTFDGEIACKDGEKPYMIYSDAGATTIAPEAVWDAAGEKATIAGLESGKGYSYYIKDKNGCNIKRVDLMADCSCGAQLVMLTGKKACAASGEDIEILLQASGGDSYSFSLVNVALGTKVLEVKNDAVNTEWKFPVRYADRGEYRIDGFVAVTASAPEGCDGNVTPRKVDVQFHPTPRIDAGPDLPVCGTGKVTLKANGDAGLVYSWDKGVVDGEPFNPPMGVPTVYTVTGVDANGCSNTDQVTVSANPKPQVSAMATPNVVCKGYPVTLNSNGDANTYEWNNGGVEGGGNLPETTTRYTVTGTNTASGCTDTASVLVVVNLPAEIVERPKDRTIAIGKDVTYKVTAIGNNLSYEWQWQSSATGMWTTFTDNTATSPKVSGATTAALLLEQVPQAWDGRKIKCIVKGDCGDPMEAIANLWVKECFDITVDLQMLSGIRPETTPGSAVDGWYCKGNKIALKAVVALADPQYGTVANPHFTWTIDGLPAQKVIESDSSVLSWIPEYYEDDIVIRVCAYSDGACDEVCSRYLRLKARTPDNVRLQIVTSADPDRKFCPGDTIDFTVALKNEGRDMNIHWYRDIFDKGTGRNKTFVMDQKDTWIKAVYVPSAEQCVENVISDSAFLQVKEYVHPTLRIENNIGDTIACQGDSLLFRAIWSNAGANPQLSWRQDIWDRGYGEYALIGLNDKDTWVECRLKPGNDVCFSGPALRDTMVIRVRENGTVTIAADMKDKLQGDLLTFISEVKGMTGSWEYSWYVNTNMTSCVEKDYSTDVLKQGDVVQCAINGHRVCLNKVFSNEIVVDYVNGVERDTMLYIYQNEIVRDMDMAKPCDIGAHVVFMIETQAGYGTSTITPDGKFTYLPNPGFVGTDLVKYVIRNKADKVITAEGYIYITVKNNARFLVPNIITPNDDGLNDTWKLDFLADYPNHIITIFDRSGQIVFEGRKYQNDWDGTGMAKGGYVARINLVNGVYTYVIDLGDKDKTVLKSWIEIRANLNRRNYR